MGLLDRAAPRRRLPSHRRAARNKSRAFRRARPRYRPRPRIARAREPVGRRGVGIRDGDAVARSSRGRVAARDRGPRRGPGRGVVGQAAGDDQGAAAPGAAPLARRAREGACNAMNTFDDPQGRMARFPSPADADRLLDGRVAPDDLPEEAAPLARLLAGMRTLATADAFTERRIVGE